MKKLLTVLFALMMVLSLAACGKKADDTKTDTASTGDKIVIKFAAQGDSTSATKDAVAGFNASQDKYVVEWVDMSNDSNAMKDALKTSLAAGSSDYDVISMDVCWAGEFAAAGYIQPLDEMIKNAGLNISDFNSGSMSAGKYNGKNYALPFFPDLGVLFYRADILDVADQEKLVAGPCTWAELQAIAEKYKGQGGTTEGLLFQAKKTEGLVCNTAEYTAGWTDIKNGLQAMKNMVDSDGTPKDITNYTEGETEAFMSGYSVLARNWPYMNGVESRTLKDEQIGYAPLPGGSCVGGWLLGINKNSKNPEGAFEFIKYLAAGEGAVIQATTGNHLPGYNPLMSDAKVLAANPMLSNAGFQKALATTVSRPVSADYAAASDAVQTAVSDYLAGSIDLDTAAAAVELAVAQ